MKQKLKGSLAAVVIGTMVASGAAGVTYAATLHASTNAPAQKIPVVLYHKDGTSPIPSALPNATNSPAVVPETTVLPTVAAATATPNTAVAPAGSVYCPITGEWIQVAATNQPSSTAATCPLITTTPTTSATAKPTATDCDLLPTVKPTAGATTACPLVTPSATARPTTVPGATSTPICPLLPTTTATTTPSSAPTIAPTATPITNCPLITTPPTTATVTPSPTATTTPGSGNASSLEAQMLDYINQARRQQGLSELVMDSRVVELARLKSQDMINLNYFDHYSPTYGSITDMLNYGNVSFLRAGENIAMASDMLSAHNGLMNSPGHYRNIMGDYNRIGIGIVQSGNTVYVTQLFIYA